MPSKKEYWKNPEKYRAAALQYSKDHPEWHRDSTREWAANKRKRQSLDERNAAHRRAKQRDPIGYLLKHAKHRAASLGVPFDLTRNDLVMPDVCPVFGTAWIWGEGQRGRRNMFAPSIDRIDPSLGYVRGNVAIISTRANHIKGNASVREMEKVLDWMRAVGAPYGPNVVAVKTSEIDNELFATRIETVSQLGFGW